MSHLDEIEARVEVAEAKRDQARRNADPIFSASMMLAIQASSADVPPLLAALREVFTLHGQSMFQGKPYCLHCGDDRYNRVLHPCPTVHAVTEALEGK